MALTSKPQVLPLFQEPPKPKLPLGRFFCAAAAVIMVLIAAAFFFVARTTAQPAKVAVEFFADLQSGQIDSAWALTSAQFRDSSSINNLNALSVSIRENAPNSAFKTVKREYVKGTAIGTKTVIRGTVEGLGGKTYQATADLAKENGEWRVFAFRISEAK